MRALVMTAPGGSENTELQELDVPRPGPGEVSIDVAYAGLNFMDVMARRGDAAYVSTWPHRPGLEVSGTIREIGADVTGFAVGDRVAAAPAGGGLAEVVIALAALTVLIPDGAPLREAAATPAGLATSMLVLSEVGRFAPGETVLVHSASGGIGTAVAQLVPLLGGGRLIGTVGRPDKVSVAESNGYDVAIARGEGLADAIRSATNGHGVDLILDPLGTSALDLDLDVVASGGRIVLFGNPSGGSLAALPPAGRLIGGNIALTGFSHRGLCAAAPHRVASAVRRTLEFMASGELKLTVTELASLSEVPATHDLLADGRGTGKYVVQVRCV